MSTANRFHSSLPLTAEAMGENIDDPETTEYTVGVRWLKTVPREEAVREPGMFANQNIVCKMRNKFTIDRLTERFGLTE